MNFSNCLDRINFSAWRAVIGNFLSAPITATFMNFNQVKINCFIFTITKTVHDILRFDLREELICELYFGLYIIRSVIWSILNIVHVSSFNNKFYKKTRRNLKRLTLKAFKT